MSELQGGRWAHGRKQDGRAAGTSIVIGTASFLQLLHLLEFRTSAQKSAFRRSRCSSAGTTELQDLACSLL